MLQNKFKIAGRVFLTEKKNSALAFQRAFNYHGHAYLTFLHPLLMNY